MKIKIVGMRLRKGLPNPSSELMELAATNSRQHRRAVALRNEQQHLHRGSPFVSVVFGLGKLRDVERGIA